FLRVALVELVAGPSDLAEGSQVEGMLQVLQCEISRPRIGVLALLHDDVREGIANKDAGVTLPVVEILSPENGTSHLAGAVDDHCIPKGDLEFLVQIDRSQHISPSGPVTGPFREIAHDYPGFRCAQGRGQLSCNNAKEFLENLNAHGRFAGKPQILEEG